VARAATVAGTGAGAAAGSGEVISLAAYLAGAGISRTTGSGALTAGEAAVASVGGGAITGAGALAARAGGVAGAGIGEAVGSGALLAKPVIIRSIQGIGGDGDLAARDARVTGLGRIIAIGTGRLRAASASLDCTALPIVPLGVMPVTLDLMTTLDPVPLEGVMMLGEVDVEFDLDPVPLENTVIVLEAELDIADTLPPVSWEAAIPTTRRIVVYRGDSRLIRVPVVNADRTPADLTGASVQWAVAPNAASPESAITLRKTVGNGLSISGHFVDIDLTTDDTLALGAANHYHELKIKLADGRTGTAMIGPFIIAASLAMAA
jgi:hypothetical protein